MTNSSSNVSNHFNNKHLILGIPGKYLTRSFQSVSDGVLVLDATSQVTISLEPLLDKICHYTGLLGKFQGKIPQDSAKGARQEPRSTGESRPELPEKYPRLTGRLYLCQTCLQYIKYIQM